MNQLAARTCPHCGVVFSTTPGCIGSVLSKHQNRCSRATEEERNTYRRTHKWRPADPNYARRQMAGWRESHLERNRFNARWSRVKRAFGLTPEAYKALLDAQGGVCAICRKAETARNVNKQSGVRIKRLSVDHDHKTNKIRGLLCQHCNHTLGKMDDDPARLRAAADYLEKHQQQNQTRDLTLPQPQQRQP